MDDPKQKIVETIHEISGQYSPYDVFSDWIKCCALSIQNTSLSLHKDKAWQNREDDYIKTMQKYTLEERYKIREMFLYLVDALENEASDVLGEIYMKAGLGNKYTGQFFTPFNVSYLTASLAIKEPIKSFNGEMIKLNEPSCGGGGMIIGAFKVLKDAGINPQRYMKVVAQDLDWNGVYMTYLQLSLLGVKAVVVQGDTLMEPWTAHYPPERVLRTPAELGVII